MERSGVESRNLHVQQREIPSDALHPHSLQSLLGTYPVTIIPSDRSEPRNLTLSGLEILRLRCAPLRMTNTCSFLLTEQRRGAGDCSE